MCWEQSREVTAPRSLCCCGATNGAEGRDFSVFLRQSVEAGKGPLLINQSLSWLANARRSKKLAGLVTYEVAPRSWAWQRSSGWSEVLRIRTGKARRAG